MQDKGIEVRSVGPRDSPEFVVDAGLRKEVGVGKRLKDGAMQLAREIDIARASIAEADPQLVVTEYLRRGDPYEVHRIILRQRVDRLGGAAIRCARRVCFELATVQRGPLCDEFERASRQMTHQHFAAPDRDHRVVLGVLGMEVRRSSVRDRRSTS